MATKRLHSKRLMYGPLLCEYIIWDISLDKGIYLFVPVDFSIWKEYINTQIFSSGYKNEFF